MVVFKMRDSVPSPRYSPVCNVLRQWKTSLIPTYRVYRVYDYSCLFILYRACTNRYRKTTSPFRITTRKPLGSNCWRRIMDGPPKLGVSGKNWTAPARVPGKLLIKLIFPECAHYHTDGRIFLGNRLHLTIHPCPVFNIPIQVVARCDPKRWSCLSMPWSASLVFLAWEKILSVHKFVRPKLAASDFELWPSVVTPRSEMCKRKTGVRAYAIYAFVQWY